MIDRIRTLFRDHGEASAMLAGGAGVLVVIIIGIVLLQGAMGPGPRATTASVDSSSSPSPEASYVLAYPSPSMAIPIPTPTAPPEPTPSVDEGGFLEAPDQDAPTAEPDPTPSPTAKTTPTPAATPTAKPTPTPTPVPTATPTPDARVKLMVLDARHRFAGTVFPITKGSSVAVIVELVVTGLDRDQCSLMQVTKPDDPAVAARNIVLSPLATQTVDIFDGWNTFNASCPTEAGPVGASIRATVHDGQPEACKGFEFTRDDISPTSFADLQTGIIGTWVGCATTPWTPMYKVTFVFRKDGTYSAKSGEGLDGQRMVALYYGTDKDVPQKRYWLTDFQASGLGLADIDVHFTGGSIVRDDLRNIRLMGDKLEFEMFHFGSYGPITFRLNRVS